MECARIDALIRDAKQGQSGVLLIRGEEGIGKSSLCEYAVGRADDLVVLEAHEIESESGLAFSGLWDLLHPIADRREAIPAPQAEALEAAFALGPHAGRDRFTVCVATLSLLAAAAEEQSVLAIVDDANWLDASSAEALHFAARRLEAEGVALVMTIGDDELTLFDRTDLPELELEGLDADSTSALLTRGAGSVVAADVAAAVFTASNGNPLAILELGEVLNASQLAGEEPLPEPLPVGPRIERVFEDRLTKLSDSVRSVLLVAASSMTGSLEAIDRALDELGLEPTDLGAAQQAGLIVVADGQLRFRHPLLRSTVYHNASSHARRAAHEALAVAAVGERADDRRAWHLAAATREADPEVVRELIETAHRARARGGHAEAAKALERAGRLSESSVQVADLLHDAANEARLAGHPDKALALLDEAVGAVAGNRKLKASIRHLRGVIEMWRGEPMRASKALLDEAEQVEDDDPERAARMLSDAAWAALMAGEISFALTAAERAAEVGEHDGGVSAVLGTSIAGICLLLSGRTDEARELLATYEPLLDQPEFLEQAYYVVWPAGHVLTWLERFDDARRVFNQVVDAARESSSPSLLPYALAGLAELDFRTGAWHSAQANGSEAVRVATETAQATAFAFSLVTVARLDAARGRAEDCRTSISHALELASLEVGGVLAYAGAAEGLLDLSLGHNEESIGHLRQVARRVRERGLGEPSVIQWAPDLIEACVRSGLVDEATEELERFTTEARATNRQWALAASARCRGLLASDDEFEEAFSEALSIHGRLPMPFEHARTQLAFGERLRRSRHRSDARPHLRAAIETFERLGAAPWAERARVELRATGESIGRESLSGLDALTPQELQVAIVVARGATNKEAGAALFLSPKTIEAHLGRIYRKLEIRSRTELARVITEEGLLDEASQTNA